MIFLFWMLNHSCSELVDFSFLSAHRKTSHPKPLFMRSSPPLHNFCTFSERIPSGHCSRGNSSGVRPLTAMYGGADRPLAVKVKVNATVCLLKPISRTRSSSRSTGRCWPIERHWKTRTRLWSCHQIPSSLGSSRMPAATLPANQPTKLNASNGGVVEHCWSFSCH